MVFDRIVGYDRVAQLLAPDVMTMLDARYINHTGNQTMTGQLLLTGASPQIQVAPSAAGPGVMALQSSGAGQFAQYVLSSGGSGRWALVKDSVAEGGGNAGSDFAIQRFNDAGAAVDNPLTITRSTGNVTLTAGLTVGTNLTINGALDHNGTTVGFYNIAPVVRPAAYTQTFATASRTHGARAASALTDSTGGTASQTIATLAAFNATTYNNNNASLTDEINKLITDLASTASVLNQLIDDLQANGLLQ